MTRNLFAITLLFINSCILAQQVTKKQQGGREKKHTDRTVQIKTLYRFVDANMNSNAPLALEYAKMALSLAEKTHSDKDIAMSCYLLGRIYGDKMADYENGIL